jgi:hypothetical protein
MSKMFLSDWIRTHLHLPACLLWPPVDLGLSVPGAAIQQKRAAVREHDFLCVGNNFHTRCDVNFTSRVALIIELIQHIFIHSYVPALALSQVSGINLHLITMSTSILCIFYTTVGGLKVQIVSP